jgi:transcriptional regulator with XRE-family HTH domain
MPVGPYIQAWRLSRRTSVDSLAAATNLSAVEIEGIEAGTVDPSSASLESIASALNIPAAWLFSHPSAFDLLFHEPDEDEAHTPSGPDPVTERILAASKIDRSLYVMLTALIQSGEPRLLRAAEMSLKSLVKQSRQATVPWLNRPSGHFEPPSD